MIPDITISDSAIAHLRAMLDKHVDPGAQLRIYVLHPGTSMGHSGIAYWSADSRTSEDAYLDYSGFKLYYNSEQAPFLDGATVDYRKVFSGYTLSLQAPQAKVIPQLDENSPLAHRITAVLETAINPHLSEHSGTVVLEQVKEGGIVILKFGGGCQGCGQAELTLRDTVEKTLKQHFPEITAVVDGTDHDKGSTPYLPRDTAIAA